MMDHAGDDRAFYARREQQERALSHLSGNSIAVMIHLGTADSYAAHVRQLTSEPVETPMGNRRW